MKKHVDPKAPVPLRMMAAKALVPLSPGRHAERAVHALVRPRRRACASRCRRPSTLPAGPHRRVGLPRRRGAPAGAGLLPAAVRAERRLRRDADSQREHARRRGRGGRRELQQAHGRDHRAEPAAPAAPRRHHPRAGEEPQRRRRADRRRLRLRRPQRHEPGGRAPDARGAHSPVRAAGASPSRPPGRAHGRRAHGRVRHARGRGRRGRRRDVRHPHGGGQEALALASGSWR